VSVEVDVTVEVLLLTAVVVNVVDLVEITVSMLFSVVVRIEDLVIVVTGVT
jgi:hypothetical protein